MPVLDGKRLLLGAIKLILDEKKLLHGEKKLILNEKKLLHDEKKLIFNEKKLTFVARPKPRGTVTTCTTMSYVARSPVQSDGAHVCASGHAG